LNIPDPEADAKEIARLLVNFSKIYSGLDEIHHFTKKLDKKLATYSFF